MVEGAFGVQLVGVIFFFAGRLRIVAGHVGVFLGIRWTMESANTIRTAFRVENW